MASNIIHWVPLESPPDQEVLWASYADPSSCSAAQSLDWMPPPQAPLDVLISTYLHKVTSCEMPICRSSYQKYLMLHLDGALCFVCFHVLIRLFLSSLEELYLLKGSSPMTTLDIPDKRLVYWTRGCPSQYLFLAISEVTYTLIAPKFLFILNQSWTAFASTTASTFLLKLFKRFWNVFLVIETIQPKEPLWGQVMMPD